MHKRTALLDPIVRGLLDQIAADPAPKLWDEPPARGRARYRALTLMLEPPDLAIGHVDRATMPAPSGAQLELRVYTPVSAEGAALPAIVYFHGGGWVFGDLDTHDALCRALANQAGARLVSVNYRLAPECGFPAAPEDCYAATRWVSANAARFAIDPERISVAGDSAGGNLAAVVCLMARERNGPRIIHQLLIYPVTKWKAETASMNDFAEGYFLEKAGMHRFFDQYAPGVDPDDWRISPLAAADLAGLPRATVVTAGFDPLKDEGKAYADRLEGAGVTTLHVEYPAMIHGFVTMSGVLPTARRAIAEAAAALRVEFER